VKSFNTVQHSPIQTSDMPTVIINNNQGEAPNNQVVGTLLDDQYTIVEVRGGQGVSGMGVIYIVKDLEGRTYAVKTFQHRFAQDLSFIQRFIREARTWMLLGFHPNIAHAYSLDIIESTPYLFMEFVPSDPHGRHSLADYLKTGPLELDLILHLAVQFCRGMAHATQSAPGLVHRDIKPENLLITPERILKITDFGLVRCASNSMTSFDKLISDDNNYSDSELTQTGSFFGTPTYMAPEQFRDVNEVTVAADIYAFGCCLYHAVTGTPPFKASGKSPIERTINLMRMHLDTQPKPIRTLYPQCPPELENIIMGCLDKNPNERYSDFLGLQDRLEWVSKKKLDHISGHCPTITPEKHEVELQSQSLVLLSGYEKAIKLRNLREHQNSNPYDFHLALASYFHCTNDTLEEQRQLKKAYRARGAQPGYEAIRRLGIFYLKSNALDEAESVMGSFLKDQPNGLDMILEPYIHLLLRKQRFDEVVSHLSSYDDAPRAQLLRVDLLRHQGNQQALANLLQKIVQSLVNKIAVNITQLNMGDTVGWEHQGDDLLLREFLAEQQLDINLEILDSIQLTYWPELHGCQDFSAIMAWLSQLLGEMTQLDDILDSEKKRQCSYWAGRLDYPNRLILHIERDEYWFWLRELREQPQPTESTLVPGS